MTLQIQKSYDQKLGQWDLWPQGEVDISNAGLLRDSLESAFGEQRGNLVLHFDELTFMDSTGLGVIIGAYGRMKDGGYELTLRNPKENIQKLLRITGLDKLLCPELCES